MARLDDILPGACGTLSPANIRERIGFLTGSRMKDALDFRKDGKPGAARIKYLQELVAERMTDLAVDHFVTPEMAWGAAMEGEAKQVFCERTKQKLIATDFLKHRSIEYFGGTPDCLIGAYKGAEFKCPKTSTFVAWKRANVVPEEHLPQILSYASITGRREWTFVAYDPRIKVGDQMFIREFVATDEQIEKLEDDARKFLAEVEALFQAVTES